MGQHRNKLGAAIAKHRAHAGWTQAELAAAVGVAQGTVSRWENGQWAIGMSEIYRIAQALDTPAWVILWEAEGPQRYSANRLEMLKALARGSETETLP
jgi:transcriptional regulator with XRE-family HTH domain